MTEEIEFKKYEKVISSLAKKITTNKELQKDLIQEGYVGLLMAKNNYDSTIGVEFLTYAYPYIKDHISRYYIKYKKQNQEIEKILSKGLLDYNVNLDSVCFDDVESFLEGCSEDTKKIVKLIIEEDKTFREIGEQLGYSKSKISYILSKDKDKLYKNLKN